MKWKWNKGTFVAVIAIMSISFIYSGIKSKQLSNKIEEETLKACAEQGNYDCDLISQYHDECFDFSYRAQYRIKQFHHAEYNRCINSKIQPHINRQQR